MSVFKRIHQVFDCMELEGVHSDVAGHHDGGCAGRLAFHGCGHLFQISVVIEVIDLRVQGAVAQTQQMLTKESTFRSVVALWSVRPSSGFGVGCLGCPFAAVQYSILTLPKD